MKQFLYLFLIIIGFIIYANTLNNGFVYDDNGLIINNTHIKNWQNISKIFTTNLFAGSNNQDNFYRPIQTLTYSLDYSIFKLKPCGYHLTSVIIHLLNGILVFSLVNIISKNLFISATSSLLFIIHPIQTEAVTYISGRADPLTCLFMLLALLLFIKYDNLKRRSLYFGSVFFFTLSLLSKEIAIIFPFLLISYDHYFLNGKNKTNLLNRIKIRYFAFFLVLIIYIILRVTFLAFPTEEGTTLKDINLYLRLLTLTKVLFIYLKLLFLPLGLHMDRTTKVADSLFEPEVLISILGLVFLLVLLVKVRDKPNIFSFGLSWFLINIVPVSNIFPLNAFLAEHWLYIPSIGFFIAVSFVVEKLINKKEEVLKKRVIASFVLMLLLYSVLTVIRNLDWKDDMTFYSRTLKYSPNSARICYNLGNEYLRIEQFDKAITLYQEALRINPNYADAYNNLGSTYYEKGELDKAIETINKAIKIKPNNAKYYNNLGAAYADKNLFNQAKAVWLKALELDPSRLAPRENIKMLEKMGY